jgi:type IV secretion system protein VirB1
MIVTEINTYIARCAPLVATSTMKAIIATESHGNHLAIGINYGYKLRYQPKNIDQATAWVNYLVKHRYNLDIGLAQVNIKNVYKYGYKPVDMLDPCNNLKVAAQILHVNYHRAYIRDSGNKQVALLQAISAYNTGNYQSGFTNGYVQKVLNNYEPGN